MSHYTPQQYLEIRNLANKTINRAREISEEACKKAWLCPPPQNLRPATPEDIVVGQVMWLTDDDDDEHCRWMIVEEVTCPADEFKGWSGNGCRYGFVGWSVEEKA